MRQAIILHGMPSREEYFNPDSPAQSNKHWIPWLQRQLIVNGVLAQAIELPEPYRPDYEKWSAVFERLHIDRDTDLIGHSCGAGFLVRWLSEHRITVGKVALVAPWLDPRKTLDTGFFEFELDPGLADRTRGTSIFVSSDDNGEVAESVAILKEGIAGLVVREFRDRGHFTFGDMKTEVFPELKAEILGSDFDG